MKMSLIVFHYTDSGNDSMLKKEWTYSNLYYNCFQNIIANSTENLCEADNTYTSKYGYINLLLEIFLVHSASVCMFFVSILKYQYNTDTVLTLFPQLTEWNLFFTFHVNNCVNRNL